MDNAGFVDGKEYQDIDLGEPSKGTKEPVRDEKDVQFHMAISEVDKPSSGALTKEELLKYSQSHNWRMARWILLIILFICWCCILAAAITIIVVTPKCLPWWQTSVIYQIFPLSFQDSNSDGFGDLQGITDRADYLESLGIGAVWLTSIFSSGGKAFGYDVIDYKAIDPKLGTMDDFEKMIDTLREKGISVILDFVPNQSSDKHMWFNGSKLDSTDGTSNEYVNYYVWSDKSTPPNNWLSTHGGPAWTKSDSNSKSYLHQMSSCQPDLNWRNKGVRQKMENILEFWLENGVHGMNMHGIQFLYETSKLDQNEPPNPSFDESIYNGTTEQYDSLKHWYTSENSLTQELLEDWRSGIFDQYSTAGGYRVLMTDSDSNMTYLEQYYGTTSNNKADIPQNFNLARLTGELGTMVTGLHIADTIKEYIDDLPSGKWPNFQIGNYETRRMASRFGSTVNGNYYSRPFNMMLLTLPGTPICYYGDEIGMEDIELESTYNYQDIRAIDDPDNWRMKTREYELSPMQWDSSPYAGFTYATPTGGGATPSPVVPPWIPVGDNYNTVNVKNEEKLDGSMLSMFKALTKLRSDNRAFQSDNFRDFSILHSTVDVVAYIREPDDDSGSYLTIVNFSQLPTVTDLHELDESIPIQGQVAVSTHMDRNDEVVELNKIKLYAAEGLVIKI
ncbi:neutral and basic amino acid transport protein rBAT-like [Anneissia japonica]|uniref:neutral and basic amino acid transport protein rBAT-like n=1 Tax=Anneissia japonica TaxID=1529436 RepID=UPI001425B07E|nr:neutral and basic amino acid transport protein rBAT-like [Anneissia japonica]